MSEPIDVTRIPSPLTAGLAGVFSAIVWPLLWSRFEGSGGFSVELVVATVLVVALPAHAFVLGFRRQQSPQAGAFDTELLKRAGAWAAAAVATVAITALYRAQA